MFGVDTLWTLKLDWSLINFAIRAPFLISIMKFYPHITLALQSYEFLIMEKHNVSQFLHENSNLSPICEHNATLLDTEVNYWKEIKAYLIEFNGTMNTIRGTLLYAMPILHIIALTIDKIIDVEMGIISR